MLHAYRLHLPLSQERALDLEAPDPFGEFFTPEGGTDAGACENLYRV